jgi:dynein heavy chain
MASDEERNAVISFLPFSFTTVTGFSEKVLQKERRYVYTTPKSFLELITLFKTMLGKKRTELEDNREKYDKGVIKLRETGERAGEQVAELEA